MLEPERTTAYGVCEACGTPTPEVDLQDVQTPVRPLTACPSCRPDRPATDGGGEPVDLESLTVADGYNEERGLEKCPVCDTHYSGNGLYHDTVYDTDGNGYKDAEVLVCPGCGKEHTLKPAYYRHVADCTGVYDG